MPSAKEPRVRLQHILDEIDGIASVTTGLSFEQIAESYLHARAVERAVQIISEASKELPKELRDMYSDVHWTPIIGVGNLLRHEYYRIDSRDMWEIVSVHLPKLRPVIVKMLTDLNVGKA
jgi:uncharacterized protein with HEPN domain